MSDSETCGAPLDCLSESEWRFLLRAPGRPVAAVVGEIQAALFEAGWGNQRDRLRVATGLETALEDLLAAAHEVSAEVRLRESLLSISLERSSPPERSSPSIIQGHDHAGLNGVERGQAHGDAPAADLGSRAAGLADAGPRCWTLIEHALVGGSAEEIARGRALFVDPIARRSGRLRRRFARRGFAAQRVASGADALTAVARERPEIVVVAASLPDMSSAALIRRLSAEFGVPVWAIGEPTEPEHAASAVDAGALERIEVGLSKGRLSRMIARLRGAQGETPVAWHPQELVEAISRFELPNDPSLIAPLTWRLLRSAARTPAFDAADSARVATALREALLNAIEHGNLEVCSSLRDAEGDAYHRLIEARRFAAPYNERRVILVSRIASRSISFIVRDQGPGFDPNRCADPTADEHVERSSGRGLLLIRAFMDEVSFNGAGNEITLIKRTAS